MNYDFQKNLQMRSPSPAACMPPAFVEETGWDILLALHTDRGCELTLEKLTSLISVSEMVMGPWLAALENRRLITGVKDSTTGQIRALLTTAGRELLDRYLSATTDLQV